ncbi:MAG: amidohydrolase family protein, partial [Planctomycetes bacterium]|nr:amidohydrolase family protein [Planctomycetota bacterium]
AVVAVAVGTTPGGFFRRVFGMGRQQIAAILAVSSLVGVLAWTHSACSQDDARGRAKGIDVHMHLLPAPGPRGTGPSFDAAADNLVATMDRLGIEQAIVMPPPQRAGQPGGYSSESLLPALRKHAGRLVLGAGGGELSPMILATAVDGVTPAIRREFEEKAEALVRAGARAFGEMAVLHFSFNERHPFLQVPPDHPLFLLLADIAARHGRPIDLHWEAVPAEMATPEPLRRISPNNPERVTANVPGLERLLEHNRKAQIVLVHGGWDNTGFQTPELLRRLLGRHPNLFCALKFVRPSYERFRAGNHLAGADLKPEAAWVKLIGDFPDRFVVGADEFIVPAEARGGGSARRGPPSFEDTWTVIEGLPAAVRAQVGRENAVRIYGL